MSTVQGLCGPTRYPPVPASLANVLGKDHRFNTHNHTLSHPKPVVYIPISYLYWGIDKPIALWYCICRLNQDRRQERHEH